MRVIAGKYRSRPLKSLPGLDIRPTADRLRETLFNVLTAGNPDALEGSVWVDFYTGTGAVGIEALSRGAAKVHFVESSAPAADLIGENLRTLCIEKGFELLRFDALRALKNLSTGGVTAHYVYLDPPYRMEEEYARLLLALSASQVVNGESIIIAEHAKKFDPNEEFGTLKRYRKLVQGDAALSFYRRV
jgi:16S rRNA (guanine966-N2)-methyltransferase